LHTRRSHLTLIGLIVAALVGVGFLGVPGSPAHQKATLGLDLQGGLEIVLKAQAPKGQKVTQDGLTRSVDRIRARIDKLGVSEPDVRKQDPDQIVVQLPGVHDPERAAEIIGKTAQLELFDHEKDLTGPSVVAQGIALYPRAVTSAYTLLAGEQLKAKKGTPTGFYLFNAKKKQVGPSAETREQLLRSSLPAEYHGKLPTGWKVFAVPANTVVITCDSQSAVVCPGIGTNPVPGVTYFYLFKYDPPTTPELTGNDLKLSGTQQDLDPSTGEPIVRIAFTGKGDHAFQEVTRDLWERGRQWRTPQHFAIVLDRVIQSFPQIDYTDSSLSNGISGGAQITGLQSLSEAKDLAIVLQTGALPYNFKVLARTDVSATLGKDSLNQAKKAAIIGLIVVALFLLLFYRFLGLVAVLGLAIYAAFLYGAILIFNVTMTLPGFAGLILTIGVAADANVVIFERIKEEYRAGKSIKAAIAAGYAKGFHTIIDANVVTCITALVLFAVATAQVKGFALLLLIGTVISLVTAVAATRAMLGLLAGFRWFDNPRFMGAAGQQGAKWLQIDFMRRRYLWFAISGAVILIGAVSLGVRGLNLGIDFKGGTQVTFKTPEYVSLSNVRDQAAEIGHSDAVIQGRGTSHGESYKSFQIRTKSLTPVEQNKLTQDLRAAYGQDVNLGIQNVSSSFGRQIARLAILAVLVSLALIVLYIAIRFQFKFALPVIAALIHDIAITVGIYSLTGREVTTSTVAAVLTVLGYSIYDTIIIFDRIRENIPLMRRASFATIANVSLWETIRRSLATTFITLLPVTSLLLFGGATLKDFAFALLVGIGSGAYSSIFIAAPLLTIWKEREPEYRRRITSTAIDKGVAERVLEEAERAAAAQPEPELVPALPGVGPPPPPAAAAAPPPGADGKAAQSKRERRRQRRKSRPHGRAR
jgi:SecD/SecF fusion protein